MFRRGFLLLLPLMLGQLSCGSRENGDSNACVSPPGEGPRHAAPPPRVPRPADTNYVGPFKVGPEFFAVWDGARYRDVFVRATNMGASQPGEGPNDLTATEEQYRCWLDLIRGMGFNAVRLYVPHFPAFYKALASHNEANPDWPIYLFQGVYLPEHLDRPDADLDLHQHAPPFDELVKHTVDAIHGQGEIPKGIRGAYGTYEVDVSRWTMGWIIGREVLAMEAVTTNQNHPQVTGYQGARLRMENASPTEAWMAERLDRLVDYELTRYGTGRPFAWSNWLELDPLTHPTEWDNSKKDIVGVDFTKLEPFGAPAGHFVSYHVYPYYPNFVSEDPGYQTYSDELGPNSYLGYLHDLRRHHQGQALFVAEFGVPSSWGRAHSSHSGMHHGGLTEHEQGVYTARMARNIYSVGAAGFAQFQLTDGWWKRTWNTAPRTFPHERLKYWHDMLNAQQSYGMIAHEPAKPDWSIHHARGEGRVREVRATYDPEFVHLKMVLDPPLEDGEKLVVGFDTYADDRGESLLPNDVRTDRRNEFALSITAPGSAGLEVLRSYDLYGIIFANPPRGAQFRSIVSDSGDWLPITWRIANAHTSRDGTLVFPDEDHPVGTLRARRAAQPASSLDAVVIDGKTITARIPWGLLHFAEPPRHVVIDDDVTTPERETAISEGIAFSVSIDNSLIETPRWNWQEWLKAPKTRQRLKDGGPLIYEALSGLPYWLEP